MMNISDDLNMDIYEEQQIKDIGNILPDRIIDIHTHIFLKQNIEKEMISNFQNTSVLYNEFSFDDLKKVNNLFFKSKNIVNLVFGLPHPQNNIKSNNDYVLSNNISNLQLLLGDRNDLGYTKSELESGNWKGLKMYPESIGQNKITDVFPEDILKLIDSLSMLIMLHLPQNIIDNIDELLILSNKYKNISFIIAHGGIVQKCYNRINEYKVALEKIQNQKNVYFDLSGVNSSLFIKALMNNINQDKIMYGSDLPISLIKGLALPGKNNKLKIISKKDYQRLDKEKNDEIIKYLGIDKTNIVNIQFETIKILTTILDSNTLEDVFYNNAKGLLNL